MNNNAKPFYEFGPFRIETAERRLLRNGEVVPLTPKSFAILLLLVQNSGHIVTKGDFLETVWPKTAVEENNLSKNISLLRKALGKNTNGQYIKTIPKQGYRFVASVRESGAVRALAVLPFKILSTDESDKYLGLGVADVLITKLSKIGQILVRPTSSVLRYTGPRSDLQAVGRELRVDVLVDGSIQRSGDQIRVTVQLVRVSDDDANEILWANTFDDKFTNIFSAEDFISEQVTQALMLELSTEEKHQLMKHYTENTEAYQLYLKGRYYWNRLGLADIMKAIEYFGQAIQKDPQYTLAYTGLADSYCLLGFYSLLPPKEAMPKAKAAAMKAVKLDSTLAEAHTSLAAVKLSYDWDWSAAERDFQRAIKLSPNYVTAHQWYSLCLVVRGQLDKAIARIRRAQEIDPLSPSIHAFAGWILHFARRYDEAIEQYRKALAMDPNCITVYFFLGLTCVQKLMYQEAIAAFQKLIDLLGGLRLPIACIAHIYALLGEKEKAQRMLDELKEMGEQGYIVSYYIALIYVGLKEKALALKWLQKAYQEHPSWLIFLKVEPMLDSLRQEPMFLDLLRRIGLEPPA